MSENVSEIEFNSMVAILERLSKITYSINESRAIKDIDSFIGHLIDYYKEISSDLTPDEKKIWEKIKKTNRYRVSGRKSQTWIIDQLNELDIELRNMAKAHGYLTKNIKVSRLKVI